MQQRWGRSFQVLGFFVLSQAVAWATVWYPHRSAFLYPGEWGAFCHASGSCVSVKSSKATYPKEKPRHATVTFVVRPDGLSADKLGAAVNEWQRSQLNWIERFFYVPAEVYVERVSATPSLGPVFFPMKNLGKES